MGQIKLPPPTPKKKGPTGSAYQQFINYWAAHGYKNLRGQLAQSIYSVAKAEHIDPVTFAALILNESGGNHIDPRTGKPTISSAGAIGIGQLEPASFIGPNAFNGGVLPWAPKHKVTMADLQDPGINMRLSAAYYGYLQGKYPDSAYGHYNAGPNADPAVAAHIQQQFYSKWVTAWNPKYVPQAGTTSPPAPAGQQVPGGTAPPKADINVFKDPFVAGVDKHGKFVTTFNPNKAIQYDGVPLTRSAFLTLRDRLTTHFISYTGKRPSIKQIETYVKQGWNDYTLDVILSKTKAFGNSPIFKQYNANFGAAVKDLLPAGTKIPKELLRQAVVNQWSTDALASKLRALPTYLKSNEFKGNATTLMNVYSSIMGNHPGQNEQSMVQVRDAALAGWTADQFASYLRSQPEYGTSTEYQSKALGFLDSLGLITGSRATLVKGARPGPGGIGPNINGNLPSDKRVVGDPNQAYSLSDLGATLG